MDFGLSEEQAMIRDSVRRFIADRYTHERWRAVAGQGGFSAENWKAMAELGYLAISQPEEYGGASGPIELALVCEEFGRGLLLEPYVPTAVFAAHVIGGAASAEQRAMLLPAMIQGEKIVSVAYSEAGVRSLAGEIGTTARREGDHYLLNGRKSLVLAAPVADLLIVSAREVDRPGSDELSLYLVDTKQAGVSLASAPLLDRTWCSEVTLNQVRVPAANVLGAGGNGGGALSAALLFANLALCAEMVGIIDRAFEIAVDYTKNREQFGAPISTFQALRHKVADLAIEREMARSMLFVLLASFQDAQKYEPHATAAMAKAHIVDIGRRICAQAIQLHGAMGMTEECGVGRYFARANVIAAQFGRADQQLENYTRSLAEHIESRSVAA